MAAACPRCLAAAEALAREGIEAEVIDLRVLRPLDSATIIASVARTRRVVIVDEGWKSGSLSAEIAARLAEDAFFELDAPIRRVCAPRGADALCRASRRGGAAAGGRHRGRGARRWCRPHEARWPTS